MFRTIVDLAHRTGVLMWVIASILLCPLADALGQEVNIQIRIVDGRTGKPLRARQLLVHLDHLDTGESGSVEVAADPNETLQFVDLYSLYRCEVGKQTDTYANYAVRDVIERGVISKNFCGKVRTDARPGVLVIYMRHRHSWEAMHDFSNLLTQGHQFVE